MTSIPLTDVKRYKIVCGVCTSFRFANIIGDLNDHEVTIMHRDGTREIVCTYDFARCPCGNLGHWNLVQGTLSIKHVCDTRCTSARGPICVCSCAGANHAADWMGLSTWYVILDNKVVESTDDTRMENRARHDLHENITFHRRRVNFRNDQRNDTAVRFLTSVEQGSNNEFITSLARQWREKSFLSPKQVDALLRIRSTNQHVGTVGEWWQGDVTVKVVRQTSPETWLTILETPEMVTIKIFSKISGVAEGNKISIRAIVQSHGTYQGRAQTVMREVTWNR